eukprot:11660023-Heterocapsa_arctica.AAC.1
MIPARECVVRSGSDEKCARIPSRLPRLARMTREKGEGERANWAFPFERSSAPACSCRAGVLHAHPASFGDWARCPGLAS